MATTNTNIDQIGVLKDVVDFLKSDRTGTDSSDDGVVNQLKLSNVNEWKEFNDNQVVPLRIEQYVMYATLLNEQQDLYSKNTTLTDNQQTQLNMIDRVLSDFHNKGFGSLREFQSTDYKIQHTNLYIRYIKYATLMLSIVFIMIALTMMGLFDKTITVIVSSFMILVFMLFVLLNFQQNRVRRKYDWDKLYWKSPKNYKKENSCKVLGLY